ncbi:hypothetical protein TIFTF001_011494 [Ficus carica]|uniref:Uncharacterized protein n=1 Tax=Ficus carica TaxID=3494 RepID=A0AA88D496_FICCA|nr:hypothetical protein TIFTF001_011494 [Ficus carica]
MVGKASKCCTAEGWVVTGDKGVVKMQICIDFTGSIGNRVFGSLVGRRLSRILTH